jgi:hypothetical protein
MVACRLFAGALAVLGLSAAAASAQCSSSGCGSSCGSPVGIAPAGYAGGCGTCGVGYASGMAVAPTSSYGTFVSDDTGRRGLFGRRFFARRSTSGFTTTEFASAMPISSGFVQAGYSQPIPVGGYAQPIPLSGTVAGCPAPMPLPASGIVTTTGAEHPMPMPMPGQAVTGTVVPTTSPTPVPGPIVMGPQGTTGPIVMPPQSNGIISAPGLVPYSGVTYGTEMTTTSGSTVRRGLFSRLRFRR